MKKSFPIYPVLIASGIVLLCLYIWLITKPTTTTDKKRNNVYVVTVTHPVIKAMPITLDALGTVEAEQTVNIIPQVGGILRNINFNQGHGVKQGQLLLEIDPSVYAASLEQAKANMQRDQAQLAALKAAADRYAALAKLEYVTRQQYDDAKAAAAAQEAMVASDAALVKQAEIQLGYTQIHAPISGKTSIMTAHVGDLIAANSATPLLVINRLNPVLISFSVPQDRLWEVKRYKHTLIVAIYAENGGKLLAQGELVSINNNINGQTGMVDLKARVNNTDRQFWPGELVNVEVILTTEPKAMVIPDRAVQMGQKGHYIYVVKNNKAVIQPIALSRQVHQEAVIATGLKGDEAIIMEIPAGLTDGKAVQVVGAAEK